jgi:hypothetical protein
MFACNFALFFSASSIYKKNKKKMNTKLFPKL